MVVVGVALRACLLPRTIQGHLEVVLPIPRPPCACSASQKWRVILASPATPETQSARPFDLPRRESNIAQGLFSWQRSPPLKEVGSEAKMKKRSKWKRRVTEERKIAADERTIWGGKQQSRREWRGNKLSRKRTIVRRRRLIKNKISASICERLSGGIGPKTVCQNI